MEILKPPTDNLYKFLALSGLLLSVFSIVYPAHLYMEIDKDMLILDRDIELLNIGIRELNDKVKDFKSSDSEMEELLKKADEMVEKMVTNTSKQSITTAEESLAEVKKSIGMFMKEQKQFWKISGSHQKNLAEIGYKLKLIKFYSNSAKLITGFAIIGLLLGLIMTVSGFTLWYCRSQKYQDQILQKQAMINHLMPLNNKAVDKKDEKD